MTAKLSNDDVLESFGLRLRAIDFFVGVGGICLGFEHFGCRNVFSSEIDLQARKMYEANLGENTFGDINEIERVRIPSNYARKIFTPSLQKINRID